MNCELSDTEIDEYFTEIKLQRERYMQTIEYKKYIKSKKRLIFIDKILQDYSENLYYLGHKRISNIIDLFINWFFSRYIRVKKWSD